MNYSGDLQPSFLTTKLSREAFHLSLKFDLPNNLSGRGGLTIGEVYANDIYNSSPNKERNLNFTSKIEELQLGLEYHFTQTQFSPYIFGGLAGFHFNPFTHDSANAFVSLRLFSTEGQGLPEYPDRKMYSLIQLAIPFGFGFDFRVAKSFSIGAEFIERKLFTDYLDDVSTGYVDYSTLLNAKGRNAVLLSYRGFEQYDATHNITLPRGNPKHKDWYYTAMLTVTYHFNEGSKRIKDYSRGNKSRVLSCPRNVF